MTADPPAYLLGLRLSGRRAVVVGGGRRAASQAAALSAAGADVLVVAPSLDPELAELERRGTITIRRREFAAPDLDGAWLAFACTAAPSANAAVAAEAERRQIWCARTDAEATLAADAGLPRAEPGLTWPAQPEPGELRPGQPESGPGAGSAVRVLVLGGARSGKSVTAERMLASHLQVDYVATGPARRAGDPEWDERVRQHRRRRPAGWRTTETLDIEKMLTTPEPDVPVLIDCLATWLAGVLDECGVWDGRPGADQELARRTGSLLRAWDQTERLVIAVSNEVGSGIVPGTVSGRRFRDELGCLNAGIAARCEQVWLCTAGIPRRLR